MTNESSFLAAPPRLTRRAGLRGLGLAGLAAGVPWALPALAQRDATTTTTPTIAAPGATVAVPPLPLSLRTLANGLQVVAIPDDKVTTVSVQVWYRVGGKDDPPGRSGFAHLFEHLMFKATRDMPDGMFDRLTNDIGGTNNAFTADDVTAYHSEVPANHLARLLWAEAQRMSSLQVVQASFASERAVVQEEYRQRVLASPYGLLFQALPPAAFERHPYRRPVIGSIEDLQAAGLDDVRRFHDSFYRPDNAVLIVAGRLDGAGSAGFDALVDRYFGAIARPAAPIPRVDVAEPPRAADARLQVHGPNVPLPALALVWKGPAARSADAPALDVAAALLAAGESSRFYQSLVYSERSAQDAGFEAELHRDAGMLVAYAIAASGTPLRKLEDGLLRQIERLATQPIAEAELDKVRARLLTSALVGRETPHGQAQAVGWSLLLHDDAHYVDRELALLQAVTAADVQRVLKRHVLDAHRASIEYTQGAR